MPTVTAHFDPQGDRLSEKELLALADAGDPNRPGQTSPMGSPGILGFLKSQLFAAMLLQFANNEGAALVVSPSGGDGGTIFVGGAVVPHELDMSSPIATIRSLFLGGPQPYEMSVKPFVPQVVVAAEHYNRLIRMITFKVPKTDTSAPTEMIAGPAEPRKI